MNIQCICDKVCDLKVPGVQEACISQVCKEFVSQVLKSIYSCTESFKFDFPQHHLYKYKLHSIN